MPGTETSCLQKKCFTLATMIPYDAQREWEQLGMVWSHAKTVTNILPCTLQFLC